MNDGVSSSAPRALMPINTKADGDAAANGMGVMRLPVHLVDPAEQLAAIHAATRRLKTGRKASAGINPADVLHVIPPVVLEVAVNTSSGRHSLVFMPRWLRPSRRTFPAPPTTSNR